jgi:hypothetical protein
MELRETYWSVGRDLDLGYWYDVVPAIFGWHSFMEPEVVLPQ